jgi:hypothetical protein
VVCKNLLNTGVDIICTKNIKKYKDWLTIANLKYIIKVKFILKPMKRLVAI